MNGSSLEQTIAELRGELEHCRRTSDEQGRVLTAAGITLWSWDITSDRLVFSPPEAVFVGSDQTVMAGLFTLVHPDDRAALGAQVQALLAGTVDAVTMVHRMVAPDGSIVWRDVRGEPVRNEAGTIVRVVGTIIDVTAQRRAEEALRTSEERLQAIIENTPNVGVQGYDREGRVVFWNRASERVLGWRREEAVGRRLEEFLLPPEAAATFRAGLARLAVDRVPLGPIEYEIIRRDGSRASCLSTTFAIASQGDDLFVCMDVDITERKRAEQQVLQAAKLESIGRLAASVAHDFNNLLTAIMGYADLALRELPPGNGAVSAIGELRAAGERGAKLTAQLLSLTRRQVVRPRVLEVNGVVRGVLDLLQRLSPQIQIETVLAPDAGTVRVDATQLEQVLVNLAVNARDAMPGGGKLRIETTRHPSGAVRLALADTGPGIPPDVLPQIFEPFFTTKGDGRGTGLGLATCRRVVEEAGGTINAASSPSGTTFEVLLPAAPPPPPSASLPPAPPPAPGRETILLVDDERAIRELAAKWLRAQGYEVLTADDGAGALELARRHPGRIEVLLTDLAMPHMGGRELAQRLVESKPGVRVVFTSGFGDPAPRKTHEEGEDESVFVPKPYRLPDLSAAIRTVLARR